MDPASAHELLERERTRIEGELGSDESQAPLESSERMEPGDRSSEDLYEDELSEARREQLQDELAAVTRAEERLAAGTYGTSVESGEPIPDERLEAVPTA